MDESPVLGGPKRIIAKLKQLIRPTGNVHEKRLRRKMKLVDLITRRITFIEIALFTMGYVWMIVIPSPFLGRTTYIDENALQPGQVNTQWNWGDVHIADQYLSQLEEIRDANNTSEQRAQWLAGEFGKLGISSSIQRYNFATSTANLSGTNAYAIISSPRHSGAEAMVVSASWLSRVDEGKGTINIRGVSTVLALAGFLKRYSYWGKDIILLISDGYLDGMQAWLGAYHGSSQPGLQAESLKYTSGVVWTALNIDYPGHSFSHLGVFFEGLNGRLPNQDLVNSLDRIARYTAGVPVILYDHLDPREDPSANSVFSWVLPSLYNIPVIKGYLYQARNVIRHMSYQYNGQGSGVHGSFHQFRIDAITLFAVPATGPHGFHAVGRTIESTLRTMNNLLERLHASFFFYILTGPQRFLKIGLYLPSAILISVAMMFHGLNVWVKAGWIKDKEQKGKPKSQWRPRQRPIIGVLSIMVATHLAGVALFRIITSSWFTQNYQLLSPLIFLTFSTVPVVISFIFKTKHENDKRAPSFMILKALNLCFTSTLISIIVVLNFSLAVTMTILLGIPLTASSPSSWWGLRVAKYSAYALLGLGWLLVAQEETLKVIWNWEVLSVWFAPFVCIIYAPLALQAGISCLL